MRSHLTILLWVSGELIARLVSTEGQPLGECHRIFIFPGVLSNIFFYIRLATILTINCNIGSLHLLSSAQS
jgi:hypothetical protein